MLFNPAESIDFNGNTGPFIQYTYARIRSLLRKAEAQGYDMKTLPQGMTELSQKEQELIQHVAEFPDVVKQAGADYSPSSIANYCFELTKEFNQFYHDFSILREEDAAVRDFRLILSRNVAKVVRTGMGILGIEMPERM
jgi:arginyl-tRNA synthetase